jgi:hypothetical protein
MPLIFPWAAPTRTSDKAGGVTTPEDVDDRQQFLAMPRRIRLIFQENISKRPCDLTGQIDAVVVKGFLMPLRFRRLLSARTDQEILIAFRRLVALANHTINIPDLVESILDWTDEDRGDQVRTRWAFAYHDAAIGAPRHTEETNERLYE